jgi:hypothetical protein
VEAAGELTFDIGGRPFTVTAKADRIEPTADGLAHILDYKTGAAPSKKQVETGFSPQLTLTAAILREGGFKDIGPREPGDLTYLRVTGRKPAGVEEVRAAAGVDSQEAAIKALNGLRDLIERYDNPKPSPTCRAWRRSSCTTMPATTATWRGCSNGRPAATTGRVRRMRARAANPPPLGEVARRAGGGSVPARLIKTPHRRLCRHLPHRGRILDVPVRPHPPPDPQRIAADPAISAFVTANAGSGKTKTLIDRVARLLLAGSSPEAILCVTYTKAAAAEMQRRLFERLGEWCVTPDVKLREQLGALEGRDPASFTTQDLSEARGLFAKALETPGGLKIQTIHAFCEKLLRRFPLEAGVSPGFQVMDDSASAAIAQGALRQVATYVTDHDDAFAQAYARFSVALDFASFEAMFATFESQRGAIGEYLEKVGGLQGAVDDVWKVCGFHYGPAASRTSWPRPWPSWTATSGAPRRRAAERHQDRHQVRRPTAPWPPIPTPIRPGPGALFTEKGAGTPATWPAKTSGLKAARTCASACWPSRNGWRKPANGCAPPGWPRTAPTPCAWPPSTSPRTRSRRTPAARSTSPT